MSGQVEHVVIIIKENHSFDNYFGRFPGANGDPCLENCPDPPDVGPPHSHEAWLDRDQGAVRKQYSEDQISDYYRYAREYTLCDNYFTEVAGPSAPNHLMLVTADSPIISGPHHPVPGDPRPPFDLAGLPGSLERAGLDWREYGGSHYVFQYLSPICDSPRNLHSDRFVADASSGNLPPVSWVYAEFGSGFSEHPKDSVARGMKWTTDQVNAVVKGGLWNSTAIFITWDDWGGWFDHVTVPLVESWRDGTQFRYGNRVPCLVLGGHARRHYISKVMHSHVSLLKFCETVFDLSALNGRDAAADDMMDCFDFGKPLPPSHPL